MVALVMVLSTAYLFTSLRFLRAFYGGGTTDSTSLSPYEQRKPGEKLPVWAKKNFVPVDDNIPEVCFVHLGKTAGSTLACMLGFDYEGCETSLPHMKSYLTLATRHLIKNMFNDCKDDTPYYLFTARNPLERIESWFVYERPFNETAKYYAKRKPLFVDCPFATISDLAERGLGGHSDVSAECQTRAWDAIEGRKPYAHHNYYNYRYYLDEIPHDASLFVVRSEHLTDDWNSIEMHLHSIVKQQKGGDIRSEPYQIGPVAKSNKARYSGKDRQVSPQARRLLCQALCEEIQLYKKILHRAINLNSDQVQESLDELAKSCPEQSAAQNCSKRRKV